MARPEVQRRLRLAEQPRQYRPGPMHVERDEDGWRVREDGDDLPLFTGPSRNEAFVWATDIAQRQRRMVVVHRSDGGIASVVDFVR